MPGSQEPGSQLLSLGTVQGHSGALNHSLRSGNGVVKLTTAQVVPQPEPRTVPFGRPGAGLRVLLLLEELYVIHPQGSPLQPLLHLKHSASQQGLLQLGHQDAEPHALKINRILLHAVPRELRQMLRKNLPDLLLGDGNSKEPNGDLCGGLLCHGAAPMGPLTKHSGGRGAIVLLVRNDPRVHKKLHLQPQHPLLQVQHTPQGLPREPEHQHRARQKARHIPHHVILAAWHPHVPTAASVLQQLRTVQHHVTVPFAVPHRDHRVLRRVGAHPVRVDVPAVRRVSLLTDRNKILRCSPVEGIDLFQPAVPLVLLLQHWVEYRPHVHHLDAPLASHQAAVLAVNPLLHQLQKLPPRPLVRLPKQGLHRWGTASVDTDGPGSGLHEGGVLLEVRQGLRQPKHALSQRRA
eukprot:RCo020446